MKFHQQVVPMIGTLMLNEPLLKLQPQAVSVLLNFIQGLNYEDDDEKATEQATEEDVKKLMAAYSKDILQALVTLLRKAITEKYEPLQTEVLNCLSTICSVVGEDFAPYFDEFVPMLTEILQMVGSGTM